MNKKQRAFPAFHAGASLLLVIFIILSLVILATLSLSSALRDSSYAEKEAEKDTAYYEADAEATKQLSRVLETFSSLREENLGADELCRTLSEETGTDCSVVSKETETFRVQYQIPVNDKQALQVSLLLSRNRSLEQGMWQTETWEEITTETWEGDDSLPVLGSE